MRDISIDELVQEWRKDTSAKSSYSCTPLDMLLGSTDEDDFEMSAFDLSRVLNALQGMKQEIAGMEDGPEKRRAAAKVALGLVYGLQVEKDEETA